MHVYRQSSASTVDPTRTHKLHLRGFEKGKYAKHKSGSLNTIVDIDDAGKVVLAEVCADGSAGVPSTVEYEEFYNNYSPSTAVIEILTGWSDKRPSSLSAYMEYTAKAAVSLALRRLSENSTSEDLLRLHLKPVRMVTASSNIAKGKLLTIPETMKMSMVEPHTDVPTGGLAVKLPESVCTKVLALMPHFAKDFVVPAWAIRATADQEKANIEIAYRAVSIQVGSGKGAGKGKDSPPMFDIRVPVFTNTKLINKDQELLIYRAPVEKKVAQKRGTAVVALQGAAASVKRSNAQFFS